MSEAFNPDYLRQHLRPLAAAEADAAVLAYQAYYGLDLRSRHPRLQARLGSMAVDAAWRCRPGCCRKRAAACC